MPAYRKSDFDTLAARNALDEWARDGVVDEAAAAALRAKFPEPFYSPNLFIRIGLFIFGCVSAMAALGLIILMTHGGISQSDGSILVVFSLGLGGGLELLIRKEKPYFRAGLEEAFLYCALAFFISGVLIAFAYRGDFQWPLALFMGCVCAAAAWRYADSLLSALALCALFFAAFDLCTGWKQTPPYVPPMLVISLAAFSAWAARRAMDREALRHWGHLWAVLRSLSLLIAYAGGNYFSVRELGHALFNQSLPEARDIPLAPVFYAFTFGLPMVYFAMGLIKKDRALLHVGLLTAALAVSTYKYYHHVMSLEGGLILAGLFLVGISWAALRAFKGIRFGLTAGPQKDSRHGLFDGESLLLLQGLASKQGPTSPPVPEGLTGGEGGFGGGGASGTF